MEPLQLTLSITLFANALATQFTDDELDLIASIFSQLGDTLVTISTKRQLLNKKTTPINNDSYTKEEDTSTNNSNSKKEN